MHKTPHIVKIFVLISLGVSLVAGVTDHIFPHLFGNYTLSWCLALHHQGLEKGFFWQLITHPFIHPTMNQMDIFYLISLLFSSYLLWKMGTTIVEQKGVKHFAALFFLNTLISSLIAIGVFYTSSTPSLLAGGTPILYALLLAMIFLIPDIDILLFLAIPIKAKWFILGSMGAFLLIDLSHGNFVHFFTILGTFSFTYFYCIFFWKLLSPFTLMHTFEKRLTRNSLSESLKDYVQNAKIYDIRTGKVLLSDSAFIDACLAKIAAKGKDSLSWRERLRLRRITKKRAAISATPE